MKQAVYFAGFGLILAFVLALGAEVQLVRAGSCYYPVTSVKWTGYVKSGVNVRDKTCMDSSVLGTLPGGTTVTIYGEADGWYQIKLADGTKGFVWNSWITVTSKESNASHDISTEYKTESTYSKKTTTSKTTETKNYETTKSTDSSVTDRVKGYILLQVEGFGEAWYVNPDDGRRYYMKDGETAYEMMRQFGLGISNSDLSKLKSGDWTLRSRLKGKIVLQVEMHGEAYYVHPEDGSVHYLKNGNEAYRIMRELSLGISNKDLNVVPSKDFSSYVYEKEKSGTPEAGGTISLTGYVLNGKVYLNWTTSGVDASKGFKIVNSSDANPVYPGNDYHYLDDPSARSDKWSGLTGTRHFRVCQYLGGSCGTYSNDLTLAIDNTISSESEGGISLTGYVENGKIYLDWTLSGLESLKGFKVVESVDANPVYPGDTYHYYSDPGKRSDVWTGLPGGYHHFRVCEYLGGSCGVYSNDLELWIDEETVSGSGSIELSGYVANGKAYLEWSVLGVDVPKGFKVVESVDADPVYPGNTYHYYSDPDKRTDTWTGLSSGIHHFRVCQYLGGSCGVYSNDLTLIIQ